ncbi:MAG TPA: cytochrome c, partial [Gemmatimonadaceae bacterium]
PGRGDAVSGATLYRTHCASCHGNKGEGIAPNPALVGRDPRDGFPFGTDPALVRTVGNYWPHATTLFDYIRRTMPLSAPGSLRDDEVYSLTAFLLAANEVIPPDGGLDSASLVAVRMPARDRFVPDDRKGGREIR